MEIRHYDDVPEEPRFDPSVHLDLQMPRFIRLLPCFDKSFKLPEAGKDGQGSPLAWSSPFQVRLSVNTVELKLCQNNQIVYSRS